MYEVKQKAGFVCMASGAFSKSEMLLLESGCDPREVGVAISHMTLTLSHFFYFR